MHLISAWAWVIREFGGPEYYCDATSWAKTNFSVNPHVCAQLCVSFTLKPPVSAACFRPSPSPAASLVLEDLGLGSSLFPYW
jgi:hypothetical protein